MKVTLKIGKESYSCEEKDHPNMLKCVEVLLKEAGELDEDFSLDALTDDESATLNYCY
jgi:hypothetical protein|tara:strand:- start:578 stop:751 length:174 start_codon:yes stop_codon:yes gene_type:complete